METVQQSSTWFSKQGLFVKVAIGCSGLFVLCCLCSIPIAIFSPAAPTPTPVPTSTPTPIPEFSFNEIIQSPNVKGWTDTQYSTYFETIKGKQVNGWSGTILEIKEWGGEPYLSLDIKSGEPEIDAYVYISKDDVLKVGLGQKVTFAGIIDSNWAEPNDYYALQIKDVTLLELGDVSTPTPEPPTAIPSITATPDPYIYLFEVSDLIFLDHDANRGNGKGLKVYMGEQKLFIFEIIGGGDCPSMPSGQGYLVRYPDTGNVEWKDRRAMEESELFVDNDSFALYARDWKVYYNCP